jgi:hypothetical protein
MYTYREQLDTLAPIRLKEGQTKRINCPFCGGYKTMGITIKGGNKIWNCFKASCGVRGRENVGLTLGGLRKRLEGRKDTDKKPAVGLPPHLSSPHLHPEAIRYLKSVNSMQAFEDGLVDIKYSPALKRVIFMMPDKEGGVGRSLIGEKPKWKNFGDTTGILRIGTGDTAVVVEDAASAASVSRFTFCSGCALLGTNISSLQRTQLCHFTNVIIALDKDASKKALKLKSKLEGRVNTRVVFLEDDLKWLTYDQLGTLLS